MLIKNGKVKMDTNKKSNIIIKKQNNKNLIFEINVFKSNIIVLGILLFFSLFCLAFPILIFVIAKTNISFGYIISFLIFISSAIFFFRVFLWNYYGKERYNIFPNKLIFYSDYKVFKDNKKNMLFDILHIGYCTKEYPNDILIYNKDRLIDVDCYLVFIF